MKLYYFNIDDTPEVLKSKRNGFVKEHHPDKAPEGQKAAKTEIMKRINAEYEFLLKEAKRSKVKEPTRNKSRSYFNSEEVKQAEYIFQLLTDKNFDNYFSLVIAFKEIKDWKTLSKTYCQVYGISILEHLKTALPLNEGKLILSAILKLLK